jgi:hypothetical protein
MISESGDVEGIEYNRRGRSTQGKCPFGPNLNLPLTSIDLYSPRCRADLQLN